MTYQALAIVVIVYAGAKILYPDLPQPQLGWITALCSTLLTALSYLSSNGTWLKLYEQVVLWGGWLSRGFRGDQRKARGHLLPLPEKRPRRLTIAKDDRPPVFFDQRPKSRFFAMLPYEIRRRIWELALGADGNEDQVIHLMRMEDRMAHTRCRLSISNRPTPWHRHLYPAQPFWKHACWGKTDMSGIHLGKVPHEPPDQNLIAPLLTCKSMYTEAIDVLYAGNMFCIRQGADLPNLMQTILPSRLQSIRRLKIETAFKLFQRPWGGARMADLWAGDDMRSWSSMCTTLQHMMGLRELHVRTDVVHNEGLRCTTDQVSAFMLQELGKVPPKRTFEVKMHWHVNDSVLEGLDPDRPFMLETMQYVSSAEKYLYVVGYPQTKALYSQQVASRSLRGTLNELKLL